MAEARGGGGGRGSGAARRVGDGRKTRRYERGRRW